MSFSGFVLAAAVPGEFETWQVLAVTSLLAAIGLTIWRVARARILRAPQLHEPLASARKLLSRAAILLFYLFVIAGAITIWQQRDGNAYRRFDGTYALNDEGVIRVIGESRYLYAEANTARVLAAIAGALWAFRFLPVDLRPRRRRPST